MKSGLYYIDVKANFNNTTDNKADSETLLVMSNKEVSFVSITPTLPSTEGGVATLNGFYFQTNEKGEVESIARLTDENGLKEHERIFFALCYRLRGKLTPRDVVHLLDGVIHHKRCWYYLAKWSRLGFYDSGVTEDLGWFYPENLPPRYLEIVKESKQ